MKLIPLSRGMFTVVDDADFEWASQFKWSASKGRCDSFYAVRSVWRMRRCGTVGSTSRQMQRDLLDPDWTLPYSIKADHKNGNTLDNQRENLRLSSDSGSNSNRRLFKKDSGLFKGVDYCPLKYGKLHYVVRIKVDGKTIYGKMQADPVSAALEYNRLARRFHGAFANLNIIPGDPE